MHEPPPEQLVQPQFFNAHSFRTIAAIAELIIPKTGTPGAIAARVPEYIDLVVGRSLDHQLLVADGLRWVDAEAVRNAGKSFVELLEDGDAAAA